MPPARLVLSSRPRKTLDLQVQPSPRVPSKSSPITTTERAEPGWPAAVIAGAFQTGVVGVRTLQRRGVRAYMFDCNRALPGFHSVYGPARLCPDPDSDSENWLRFAIELAGELAGELGERPVLIASSDKFVSAIARYADTLRKHYIFSPGAPLAGLLADKLTQYTLAAQHGMPMPLTRFVGSIEEVEEFARAATFPCLIKPNHFREWEKFPGGHPLLRTKVAVAPTAQSLLESYRLAASVTPQVILQEIIQGPDTAKRVYLSCYNADSQRIANAMFLELRCDPLGFGPASVTEPVEDAEADAVCDRFLRNIKYVGICEIEVKRDTRDGRVKLIEANPRLSGGGDAAPYAGVDLCWLHYCDLIGRQLPPVSPRGNHFKHVVLRADGSAVPSYWQAGLLTWRDLLRSYRGSLAFYDLDRRDWRYSLETIYVATRLLIRGVVRALLQRERKP